LIKKQFVHRYISSFIFLCILILSRKFSGFYIDLSLGLSILLLINSLQFTNKQNVYFENINHKMADFSYSLYLLHFPFFVWIISIYHNHDIRIIMMQPTFSNLSTYLLILCAIYFYSYIIYLIFEKSTHKIQSFLIKKVINVKS
jgi:peptidoglycan/LPS O-acetylase OafA/YrhL